MKKPQVSIIMGSDSDLPAMQAAADVLEGFSIGVEVTALSAHRAPSAVAAYAKNAEKHGVRVIIAGAGLAAHLPGVIAAFTPLPVIGVPIKSSSTAGIDSLFAIAQMPPGVPVATVAINGAKNAGILAAQMLGTGDTRIRKALVAYKKKMEKEVLAKAARIGKGGFRKYLAEQKVA
ncbi:MAG: 5-(carboxyamino)imidazole ribonucleotide mutase [Patescibacteria group bacterium]|nr:5-(carboxyamino)imidazole ribonucleotide mutase [Patescibacteria group bacterium]MDE1965860.1 5-(carboxyamino)imidazole ribonucleotide mutase [Patescibacteria group bacterium]